MKHLTTDDLMVYAICLKKVESKRCIPNIQNWKKVFTKVVRFDAIIGDDIDITNEDIVSPYAHYNITKSIRHSHADISTNGAIGCYLSHLMLWKKCIDTNSPIVVIEDDYVFNGHAKEAIDEVLKWLPENIGILSIDRINTLTKKANDYQEHEGYGNNLLDKIDFLVGLQSYIIFPEFAKFLSKNALPISFHVDSYISIKLAQQTKFNIYGIKNNSLGSAPFESTIKHTINLKLFLSGNSENDRCVLYLFIANIICFFALIFYKRKCR